MSQPLTANDLLPLVARLAPEERARLLHLIEAVGERDGAAYAQTPPRPDEFSADDDALAWDADGWEQVA